MGIHELFFDIETKACKKYGPKTIVFDSPDIPLLCGVAARSAAAKRRREAPPRSGGASSAQNTMYV